MARRKTPTASQLEAAYQIAMQRFSNRKNVTAIDKGIKWTDGKPTKDKAIRIHVEEKIPMSDLEAADAFPDQIEGVTVDVYAGVYRTQDASAERLRRQRFGNLVCGISIGHERISAGTLGAIVIDRTTGRPGILSNWHVLVGSSGQSGDSVVQPGPRDGGRVPRDRVAVTGPSVLDADGDAAVAWFTGERDWMPFVLGTNALLEQPRRVEIGDKLRKSGRSTGVTNAVVDGEGTYFIRYRVKGEPKRIGVNGFKLIPEDPDNAADVELSSGGDSGASWYDPQTNSAVGLHFAGETSVDPRKEHAIACHFDKAVERLDVRLATGTDIEHLLQASETEIFDVPRLGNRRAAEPTRHEDLARAVIDAYAYGRDEGHVRRLPVRRSTDAHIYPSSQALERVDPQDLGIIRDIWPRLQKALGVNPDFDGARLSDLLTKFIPVGRPETEMARLINASDAFDDLGLGRVYGHDFRTAVTFNHVCEDIRDILRADA